MGQTQTVFLPPWEPTTEEEKEHADEFRAAIQALSGRAANFVEPHPIHVDPDFAFDWVEHRPFAEAAYTGDLRLCKLIPRLVPKRSDAPHPTRQPSLAPRAQKLSRGTCAAPAGSRRRTSGATTFRTSSPSRGPLSRGATASAARTALRRRPAPRGEQPPPVTARVSYPEKFHLAAKYAADGPPLPNLSDADRILLEALHQQARARRRPPLAQPRALTGRGSARAGRRGHVQHGAAGHVGLGRGQGQV